jgi:hypothetical protein
MSLIVSQNYTAVAPGSNFVQFVASGGTSPYTYAVLAGGSGGTINASTGDYTAPPQMTAYPATGLFDTIQVTDSTSPTPLIVTTQILVGTPLFLFCDVLQNQLGLDSNHVYLWDQKIFQPTDSGLYIAISIESCKPFSNNNYSNPDGSTTQVVNMYNMLGLDIISRGPAARDMKELVILALNSTYAQQQQEANQFYIGKISTGFINLSHIDGAAIPYRFRISCALQYVVSLTPTVPYYDTFEPVEFYTNP